MVGLWANRNKEGVGTGLGQSVERGRVKPREGGLVWVRVGPRGVG